MINSEDHFKLLRKLNENPNSSQRKLAVDLGFSLGKLNYCLNELRKKGFVKVKNFKKSKKKIKLFIYADPFRFYHEKNLTLDFMQKKIREYDELKKEIKNIKRDFDE